MGKFLLLVLLGIVIYLLLARARQSPRSDKAPDLPADTTMTRCAYCGLHVPADESVVADVRSYCCEEHRRLGEG